MTLYITVRNNMPLYKRVCINIRIIDLICADRS